MFFFAQAIDQIRDFNIHNCWGLGENTIETLIQTDLEQFNQAIPAVNHTACI